MLTVSQMISFCNETFNFTEDIYTMDMYRCLRREERLQLSQNGDFDIVYSNISSGVVEYTPTMM